MFFICNNSLLFDPEAHAISIVGQPESVLTLSAPAVRLLQEFIRHKGRDLEPGRVDHSRVGGVRLYAVGK